MAILVTPSNKGFSQVGNDKWFLDGFDLDRLVQRYQGPKSGLASYISSLTMWAASGLDGNMFLSGVSADDDPVKPTVDKVYTGKKGGVTSGTLRKNNSTTRQGAAFSDNTGSGSLQITIEFYAPTNTATTIAVDATMPTPDSVGSISWSDVVFALIKITGDYSVVGSVLDFFNQVTVVSVDSQEVVKGQYYRNTKTNALMLQPIF